MKNHDGNLVAKGMKHIHSFKEAKEMAKRVGDLSRGPIYDSNTGLLKSRVPSDDVSISQAKALLDPTLSKLEGDQLMQPPESELTKYVIKGLASHLTMFDVTKILQEDLQNYEGLEEKNYDNNDIDFVSKHGACLH